MCTGNTCRSPIAQALFLEILAQNGDYQNVQVEVLSAGLYTHDGIPATAEAIEAMHKEGIDLSAHKARVISDNLVKQSDLILTMTETHCSHLRNKYPEQRALIFTLSEYAGIGIQDIDDPYGLGGQAYRKIVQQMKVLLEDVADRLLANI